MDHAWRREFRATAGLAWPLVLTFLSETAISAVDTAIIGRLGQAGLASATLALTAYFTCFVLSAGVCIATSPLAAQAHGARRPRGVRRVIRQGLWVAALITIPLSFFVLTRFEPIFLALGQPADAVTGAGEYLDFYGWTLPFAVGFLVLRNFAAVLERPRLGLWVILVGVPLNGLLDYGLVLGHFGLPRLELAGAGIASLLVHSAMFASMLVIAVRVRPLRRYRILGRFWRTDWTVFLRILRVGLPIAGILAMEFGLIVGALVMLGWIGPTALAAHQIALVLSSVTFKVPLGISQAATVRVGLAAGRGDRAGVARAGWTALGLGVGFMALASVVMWTVPELLVAVFLDVDDPANAAVFALAVTLVMVAAVFQIGDGAQAIGAGVLRGLSDTTVPMLWAGFGYWVLGLASAYGLAFIFGYGASGIWMGMAVGLIVVAVFHVVRFRALLRRGSLPGVASG